MTDYFAEFVDTVRLGQLTDYTGVTVKRRRDSAGFVARTDETRSDVIAATATPRM